MRRLELYLPATVAMVASVTVLAAGCRSAGSAARDGYPGSTTPLPEQYAPYATPGTGVIEGQAYVPIYGGSMLLHDIGFLPRIPDNVRAASNRLVTLDPATPYAMKWYLASGMIERKFKEMPPDSLFRAARRTTIADEDGRFTFTDLPPGRYIVRTTITWEVTRDGIRTMRDGGVAAAIVDVAPGERKQLIIRRIVTPANR